MSSLIVEAPPAPAETVLPVAFDVATSHIERRFPWANVLSATAILIVMGWLVLAFARGDIRWSETRSYLFSPFVLAGLVNTLWLAVAAMAVGVILGTAIAVMRASANPVMRTFAIFYQWLFRGVPLILQILIWFNLALVFPRFTIPGVLDVQMVTIITPAMAALLGIGLNQAAYSAEIIRAGLLSVDRGQHEAALAIGMTEGKALRRIIFPQAMRVVIPPMGNEFIGVVKMTSLAVIIGFRDLLSTVQLLYLSSARIVEMLFVAAFWYLVVVTLLTIGQSRLEARYGRGFRRRDS